VECSIFIGVQDQGTAHIASVVRPYLEVASARLSRDYGGEIEHLWIDIELSPSRADRTRTWPFRFQRRVSMRNAAKASGLPLRVDCPDSTNVGHFGARPDYFELAGTELERTPAYILALVHRESAVLEAKSKRLGGFDARSFRQDLWAYVEELGGSASGLGSSGG
jgi:hypothetical protein